jgi:hypothetical protein
MKTLGYFYHPDLTPYAYRANNPAILGDPDGRKIYVFNRYGILWKVLPSEKDVLRVYKKDGCNYK